MGQFPGAPSLEECVDSSGRRWDELRKSLVPSYSQVWREIAAWYLALAAGLAAALVVGWQPSLTLRIAGALGLALVVGFVLHAFILYGHEAAHYNIARDRRRNDQLGDWLLWAWLGQTTRGYRRFHWQHHLHLGDPSDTEVSYHQCASLTFVLRLVSGVYTAEALLRYLRRDRSSGREPTADVASTLRFLTYHGAVLAALVASGQWLPAVGWVTGVLVVVPALNSLRQLLEHRHEEATCDKDFSVVPHGPNTYDFGDGLLPHLFGPAGFNRHLLHHWEPTISYTNFGELESFLVEAGLGEELRRQRRSYPRALLQALRVARLDA